MRGKRRDNDSVHRATRITPADAGKTSRRACKRTDGRDHPRGCGENSYPVMRFSSMLGSPPRMRGKRTCSFVMSAASRITPADAGKTAPTERTRRNTWDHPRGCGENFSEVCIKVVYIRITPADAGKTGTTLKRNANAWDHPRGCGENIHAESVPCNVGGSPPRMRGKPLAIANPSPVHRITPADAGKTIYPNARDKHMEDHPRGCGENRHP